MTAVPLAVAPTSAATATLLRFGTANTARRRLFCLPFAGGGAATYRSWHRSLPSDVDVVAVQLPGRDPQRRLPPPDSIAAMVAAARPALDGALDLPYAIFGHSMGALVAFELAVALERAGGRSPSHLFVSGRRSPDELHHAPPIHDLPEAEFLDELQLRYGGVPDVVRREPELLALLLPALRADVRAFESYAPLTGERVRCPVDVYGGLDDRHPRPDQLPGWQRVAVQEVRVRLFPGDHFYLAGQQDVLAEDLADRLDRSIPPSERS